jgi:hypothetical protein
MKMFQTQNNTRKAIMRATFEERKALAIAKTERKRLEYIENLEKQRLENPSIAAEERKVATLLCLLAGMKI